MKSSNNINITTGFLETPPLPPPIFTSIKNIKILQKMSNTNTNTTTTQKLYKAPVGVVNTPPTHPPHPPHRHNKSSNSNNVKRQPNKYHHNTTHRCNELDHHSSLNFCNNCGKSGKSGHYFYQCKSPITSYGVIAFRVTPTNERQYLMIRRRNTLGYIDFLRGKYSLFNYKYIKSLIKQMTNYEINQIKTHTFDELWYELWKDNDNNTVLPPSLQPPSPPHPPLSLVFSPQYNCEKLTTRDKFTILKIKVENKDENIPLTTTEPTTEPTIEPIIKNGRGGSLKTRLSIYDLIDECKTEYENNWEEPEWGFCKGRRNYKESDYDCAMREMEEETGYSSKNMRHVQNTNTFEETFFGSNYKCYRHKYYLMYMDYEESLNVGEFEKTEVSCIKWCNYDECVSLIRPYNVEKQKLITTIENCLKTHLLYSENIPI
jgi:8-oxo-dGTP pyrophosphatase MutT (NUDIX family)